MPGGRVCTYMTCIDGSLSCSGPRKLVLRRCLVSSFLSTLGPFPPQQRLDIVCVARWALSLCLFSSLWAVPVRQLHTYGPPLRPSRVTLVVLVWRSRHCMCSLSRALMSLHQASSLLLFLCPSKQSDIFARELFLALKCSVCLQAVPLLSTLTFFFFFSSPLDRRSCFAVSALGRLGQPHRSTIRLTRRWCLELESRCTSTGCLTSPRLTNGFAILGLLGPELRRYFFFLPAFSSFIFIFSSPLCRPASLPLSAIYLPLIVKTSRTKENP